MEYGRNLVDYSMVMGICPGLRDSEECATIAEVQIAHDWTASRIDLKGQAGKEAV